MHFIRYLFYSSLFYSVLIHLINSLFFCCCLFQFVTFFYLILSLVTLCNKKNVPIKNVHSINGNLGILSNEGLDTHTNECMQERRIYIQARISELMSVCKREVRCERERGKYVLEKVFDATFRMYGCKK
uniref:Uncharacterized protein n=1 Tax=Cacopsylla melanoneura TaxID=428564 RepID=A0A8D8USI0_9HEMI